MGDLDKPNGYGWSPIHYACQTNMDIDITYLELLISAGANVNIANPKYVNNGWRDATPFNVATAAVPLRYEHNKMCLLLSTGADPGLNVSHIPQSVTDEVKRWLLALEAAKNLFRNIFDNESLEREREIC